MSGRRAAWEPAMEQALMELFEKAREDAELRTGRGIKATAWSNITTELNNRYKTSLLVDQLKSKYARLMMDYELFKEIGGEGSLSDERWNELIALRPDNASRIRQFKEHGCAYVEVCRRIAATKEEPEGMSTSRKTKAERKPRTKRSTPSDGVQPDLKKARPGDEVAWTQQEERLMLFLCWKAKKDENSLEGDNLKPQSWADITIELRKSCSVKFSEKKVKEKYVELMQRYNQFKTATGFSGDLSMIPKDDMDWERLIRDRPRFLTDLETFKNAGGFPHAEVCGLIKGDVSPDQIGPTTTSDSLVTGALQSRTPTSATSQTHSAHAIASAQASLSADALSYLLPTTASLVKSMAPSDVNGLQGATEQAEAPSMINALGVPAVFSQELHDNLNMFLKTATAYLVMLINDHNVEKER